MVSATQADLEEQLRRRLRDARLRIDLCRAYVQKVEGNGGTGIPSRDSGYAYRRALRAENHALREFTRLLQSYSAFVLHGKPPDEEVH